MLEKVQILGGVFAMVAVIGMTGVFMVWDRMEGVDSKTTATLFPLAVAAGTAAIHMVWPKDKPEPPKEKPGIIIAEKQT